MICWVQGCGWVWWWCRPGSWLVVPALVLRGFDGAWDCGWSREADRLPVHVVLLLLEQMWNGESLGWQVGRLARGARFRNLVDFRAQKVPLLD